MILNEMELKRAGYYRWLKRKDQLNRYEQNRQDLIILIQALHAQHKTYGYHRVGTLIRKETGWLVSDLLVHKCMKYDDIRFKAKHYKYKNVGQEHLTYKNVVQGQWKATKPLEIVVSDMTKLKNKGQSFEWTYILDTFNNEIIASALSTKIGDIKPYYDCLNQLKAKIKGIAYPTIFHTDQGAVYSSRAFNQAHTHYNIIRSMSRSGTPTDNPIIEAINGWVKEELYYDFNSYKTNNMFQTIDQFIHHFNYDRPAFALHYKTPIQFKLEQGF